MEQERKVSGRHERKWVSLPRTAPRTTPQDTSALWKSQEETGRKFHARELWSGSELTTRQSEEEKKKKIESLYHLLHKRKYGISSVWREFHV